MDVVAIDRAVVAFGRPAMSFDEYCKAPAFANVEVLVDKHKGRYGR